MCQVRVLQCALVRYLQELISGSDAVTFPLAQQTGILDGATPNLLLLKDLLLQVSSQMLINRHQLTPASIS